MTAGTDRSPTALVDVAVELAEAAGGLLLDYARRRADGDDLGIGTKSTATDPVSEADRAAEQLISDRLSELRPDDGLFGEEDQADRRGTSGLRWVVDPLDGTVNFLYGIPLWTVSVCCEDEAGPVAAAVRDPSRGETFRAGRGLGAYLGDTGLAVNPVAHLADTLVGTGFAYDPALRADQGAALADLMHRVRDIRRGGSAAQDLAWCAMGRLDAYAEFGLSPWDWAAGRLLVEEAGGIVTIRTRRVGNRDVEGLIAGGRAAHDALLAWVDATAPS